MIWVAMGKAFAVMASMILFIGAVLGWIFMWSRISDGANWGFAVAVSPALLLIFVLLTLIEAGVIQ
ncbi:hypothetical protein HGG71_05695 [Rhodobacteraceae bacterium R_SAG2]|nr:hypothetical protein [Rhodobacteraceae bacterium R_SAG2]